MLYCVFIYMHNQTLLTYFMQHQVVNEFRILEVKIEESEKAGSRRESNQRHLWLEPPVLCH